MLPEIPEQGEGNRELVLYRFNGGENEVIAHDVTLEDAQAYCSRDDTRDGPDGEWFVGYRMQ